MRPPQQACILWNSFNSFFSTSLCDAPIHDLEAFIVSVPCSPTTTSPQITSKAIPEMAQKHTVGCVNPLLQQSFDLLHLLFRVNNRLKCFYSCLYRFGLERQRGKRLDTHWGSFLAKTSKLAIIFHSMLLLITIWCLTLPRAEGIILSTS